MLNGKHKPTPKFIEEICDYFPNENSITPSDLKKAKKNVSSSGPEPLLFCLHHVVSKALQRGNITNEDILKFLATINYPRLRALDLFSATSSRELLFALSWAAIHVQYYREENVRLFHRRSREYFNHLSILSLETASPREYSLIRPAMTSSPPSPSLSVSSPRKNTATLNTVVTLYGRIKKQLREYRQLDIARVKLIHSIVSDSLIGIST